MQDIQRSQESRAEVARALPDRWSASGEPLRGPGLEGFQQFAFASGEFAHVVYHAGAASSPALLLMPEIGAFAIPLVIDPAVAAAVAAQPSVPLSLPFASVGRGRRATRRALNVSEADIAQARARLSAGGARVMGVRFAADRICPAEKLQRLRDEFPGGLETLEYGDVHCRNSEGRRPHATFTREWRIVPDAPSDHPSRQAFRDLVAFFDRHLRSRHTQEASSCSSSV